MQAMRFVLPVLLLGVAGLAHIRRDVLEGLTPQAGLAVDLLLWLAGALLASRLATTVLSRGLFVRRQQRPPRLLLDMTAVAVWLFAAMGVVTVVFGKNITDLVTASSVVVAVVGFSLRGMIADLFYGIALGLERPFEAGDWIQLPDRTIGQVVEMNWRSTRLVTREKLSVIIPNGVLAASQIRNYSRPYSHWRDSFRIHLGYDVPTHRAERLLLSAVAQVPETAATPDPPEARIVACDGRGVEWELRYWVEGWPAASAVGHAVRKAVLRNLHFAGLTVPPERTEVQVERRTDAEELGAASWLGRIDLFAPLSAEEIAALAAAAHHRLCLRGEPVVRQGDAGSSLFVVVEGSLTVTAEGEGGSRRIVGQIRPGQVFGELSLLTGAPRGATVTPTVDSLVYEITHDAIAPLLEAHPTLVRHMSHILAERQDTTRQRLSQATEDRARDRETAAEQFLARIRGFFRLATTPNRERE